MYAGERHSKVALVPLGTVELHGRTVFSLFIQESIILIEVNGGQTSVKKSIY